MPKKRWDVQLRKGRKLWEALPSNVSEQVPRNSETAATLIKSVFWELLYPHNIKFLEIKYFSWISVYVSTRTGSIPAASMGITPPKSVRNKMVFI